MRENTYGGSFGPGLALCMSSNAAAPGGARAVEPFDVEKYLGKWYEIARLDFFFEKNLNNTSAEYSLNGNGTIGVKNTGYDYRRNKWKTARGKARFRSAPGKAELEVSFFGPFYADYNVIALDENYRHALVAGKNFKYLWILSREKTIPETVGQEYTRYASSLGYDVSKLVWVQHDR